MRILAMFVTNSLSGSYHRFLEFCVEPGVEERTDDICEASICESKAVLVGRSPITNSLSVGRNSR